MEWTRGLVQRAKTMISKGASFNEADAFLKHHGVDSVLLRCENPFFDLHFDFFQILFPDHLHG